MVWAGGVSGSPAAPRVTNIEVLDARVRVGHPGGAVAEGRECLQVTGRQRLAGPVVELDRPARRRGGRVHPVLAGQEGQPVGGEPGPDHEHALVTQRLQPPAQVEEPVGFQGRHRHLQDRHVGVRVHHGQRHVGAVVQPPVGPHDLLGVGHHRRDRVGQLRGARCGVGDLVVLAWEPAEVVHQRHRFGGAQHQRGRLPVGRHHQDRLRPRQVGSERRELVHPAGVVDQRRCTVAEKQRRQPRRGGVGGVHGVLEQDERWWCRGGRVPCGARPG